jgi:hypothetical protein
MASIPFSGVLRGPSGQKGEGSRLRMVVGAHGVLPGAPIVLGGVCVSMFMSSDGGQEAGVSTRLLNNRTGGDAGEGGVRGRTLP